MDGSPPVAVAQSVPVRGDVPANVEQHLRLARAAARAGARIVLFPELSLTGYELDLAGGLAFTERDPRLAPLVEEAAATATTLVVGAPVRLGARLHIGAFIVGAEGAVNLYTKRRLGTFPASANPCGTVPPSEDSVFEPGDRDPLIRVGDDTAAVAVCADIGRPAHAEAAAARGASLYLASMFVIPSELETDRATLRSYAVRHRMAVALANFGGPSGGLPSGGGSAIWSQAGELLAELPATGAGIAIATPWAGAWRAETIPLSPPG